MRPSLRIIASGFAAVLLAACFDFDATMAGGLPSDSGADAAPPTLDASVGDGDGGRDSGSTDAGNVSDSGGPYCASLARPDGGIFFCDDFDEHLLPGSWGTWAETSGTLVETDASAVSAPSSVDETTVPLSAGQLINVALRTPLPIPTAPATLTFAFSIEPVQIDTTANAAIVLGAVDFLDSAGNRYSIGLSISVVSGLPALALGEQSGLANGDDFPDGAPPFYVNHPLPPTQPLPMNAWTSIVIELDWAATTLEGKVTVAGNQELDVPLSMTLVPSSLQIGIGTSYVTEYEGGLSPVWELRYDNVAFTAN